MQEIEDFLRWGNTQKGWAKTTLAGHRSQLYKLIHWYEESRGCPPTLLDLTRDTCEQWLVDCERHDKRPRTRYAGVSSVRAFGSWAVEKELLPDNPGRTLRLPRLDAPNQKSCTEAEKDALMDAAMRRLPTKKDRTLAAAILGVFVYTGLRRFELAALNLSDVCWDVDPRRSKLVVRAGKGRKRREIPINSQLSEHLRHWLALRAAPQAEQALWIGIAGRRLTDYSLGVLLDEIKVAAGLVDNVNISPHGFRHFFATQLDRMGVPLAEISELLGHSSLKVTLLYLQADKSRLYDAVERLAGRNGASTKAAEPDRYDNRKRAENTRRKPGWRRG